MSNDLKFLPINFYLLTMFDACVSTKLNGIFRVALQTISWASGVELNYTLRRGNVFITFTNVFFKFMLRFSTFFIFI